MGEVTNCGTRTGRPYLDGVEFPIIREVSTANLAFIADKLDWIATTIPLLKEVKRQAPEAICEVSVPNRPANSRSPAIRSPSTDRSYATLARDASGRGTGRR
jgi:hypothetical protein